MIPEANLAWKERAEVVPLLAAAQKFGAKLKKHGTEWVGPCRACGGTDRFAINIAKAKWHCRGHGGGASTIAMVMHIAGLGFKQAIEALTGEPCPAGGPAKPLSEAELAERNRRRVENERAHEARKAKEAAYQDDTRDAAARIWQQSRPIDSTLAQTYLYKRGMPPFETDALRFHPALPYPKKPNPYPALVCRVDDMGGELCAVWRVYLRADGRKADVPDAKLGLGPAGGGAVRIGGMAKKIGLAEGVESALGAWNLIGRRYPVWAALSTSGLVGVELPLGIEHVCIFPDGDRPIKKHGHEFIPAVPAGRKAAETLRARLLAEGVGVTIAAEPSAGLDYGDLWQQHSREVA
jgi:putative DNA primase/helicase